MVYGAFENTYINTRRYGRQFFLTEDIAGFVLRLINLIAIEKIGAVCYNIFDE